MADDGNPLRKFEDAAEKGDVESMCKLAIFYRDGVTQNDERSFAYSLGAADGGNADLQFHVAGMFKHGIGTKVDIDNAIKYCRLSAAQKNHEAAFNLGNMYLQGDGVAQNFPEALKHMQLASELGHLGAQFNCGLMYQKGDGAKKNPKKAFEYFKQSADGGDPNAQMCVSAYYGKGDAECEVKKDEETGFKYLKLAADAGHPDGLFEVATKFASGTGTTANMYRALKYFKMGAAQGHPGCQQTLINILKPGCRVMIDELAGPDAALNGKRGLIIGTAEQPGQCTVGVDGMGKALVMHYNNLIPIPQEVEEKEKAKIETIEE